MSGVLVVMEQRGGAWNRMSFEAFEAGLALANKLGTDCIAAVVGESVQSMAWDSKSQPNAMYAVENGALKEYTSDAFVEALAQVIKKLQPAYVVFPHTYQVRDFAPALATRFKQVLISDVVAVHEGPVFVRQLLQGKLNADYKHSSQGPCFISVQAGSFRAEQAPASALTMEVFTPELDATKVRNRPGERFRESAQTVDLSSAPVIVSVGRGIGEQENIGVVEELATALGAEIAASRPICDNGWLPMERQVGSSGQTVSPKLYLAVGISGAIQHLVGMKGSKTVIAINKDENAPIFEVADYGVVGDLFEIVPALTKAIQNAKG
jgi:electron transfer flavoprotein alpha subunit